jgi:phytoene dehydrogenase-like protein
LAEFYAIIVGGGHNGLVCASYLAKAGMSVLVIEKKTVVGGCVVTEEIFPGCKVNRYSFEHYVIQNTPIIEELSLSKFGLKYYEVDPVVFSPFRDGKFMLFYRNVDKTLSHLKRISPKDARSYEKFHFRWSKVIRAFAEAAWKSSAPSLEHFLDDSFPKEERNTILQDIQRPASSILAEEFETDYITSPIAFLGPAAVGQSPKAKGTGWLVAWHIGAERLGRPVGGSGKLSEALRKCVESYGGKIITGEKVEKISTENGHVTGVVTTSGREFQSKIVVSNADPKQTLLKLLDEDIIDKQLRKEVEKIQVSGGFTFKSDFLLNGLPKYNCKDQFSSVNECNKAATFIAPSVSTLEYSFEEYKQGLNPKEPGIMVGFPTATDPTLAPRGKHLLILETRYTPYQLKSGMWDGDQKERVTEQLLSIFSEYCPGVEGMVESSYSQSPVDMELDILLPKGNFMHADMSLRQMFDSRPSKNLSGYRTPIAGLYLCGAGTHPGGGVSGIPGRNAAETVVTDLYS